MKTIIQHTVRLKGSVRPTIFNFSNGFPGAYESIAKHAGKKVVATYKYTEDGVEKQSNILLEIPKTLTTDEQVRDYVLAEILK